MKRALAHIATIAVLLAVFVGVPVALGWVNLSALVSGQTDLVSSATTLQAAPDGGFTIFINGERHPDKEVLGYWKDFLAGKDVPLIMEDVSCVVCKDDIAGLEMAESLASRLPANQMKIHTEDGTLTLSKAETGRFDILVMSNEKAKSYDVSRLLSMSDVEVVYR
ncbi:MAG: hypothetical protein Q4B54_02415 [Coriobacteriales bacterium]|nr:hypothetical protein [Coriobacteriales bacterium]